MWQNLSVTDSRRVARRFVASRARFARCARAVGASDRENGQHRGDPDARHSRAQRRTRRRSANRLHLPSRRAQRASGHVPRIARASRTCSTFTVVSMRGRVRLIRACRFIERPPPCPGAPIKKPHAFEAHAAFFVPSSGVSNHIHRQRTLTIMHARLLGIAELFMQPSQRAMRANLERFVIRELERRFEERLRLAPQLLMQT